ncbi:MAG: hypothetical protein JSW47_21510 [Phycisphaerales bacterium]|nr:MAG: hypothetical protein JSW47_21510 [Phycisphaerales bacterium]
MKKLNLDKLVIGVLLGVCLMLAIGAKGMGTSHSVGTYRIATCVHPGSSEVYVLNTRTGQVWMSHQGRWSDLGHISGMEEVKPKLKPVYREGRIGFE